MHVPMPNEPTEPALYACSIIIPLYNRADLTQACLQALQAHTSEVDHQIVLVDNASSDETEALCRSLTGEVKVIRNHENLGFAAACNQGARAAESDRLVFLNNDTEPWAGWLPPLIRTLDGDDDVVAVGSLLLFPDGSVQHAGVAMIESSTAPHVVAAHIPYQVATTHPLVGLGREVSVVTGACFIVDRSAFFAVGGFDEGFWNGYEDVDLCLKLREVGGRIRYEPTSIVTHHESASGPERFRREDDNTRLLQSRWQGRVVPDLFLDQGRTEVNPDGLFARVHATV